MSQKNGSKTSKGASWAVIIILLIFFCYVGIPLMLSKLHKDTENMLFNAKRTITVGWIFFAIGCMYLFLGLTGLLEPDDGSNFTGYLVFIVVLLCGGGYAIVRHAKKYRNWGLMYERYLPVLSGLPTGSLDELAETVGETYDVTSKNIQNLIDIGLLENSYIDKTRRSLVSPVVSSTYRPKQSSDEAEVKNTQQAKPRASKVHTIKCPNCGGVNNVTEGAVNICDYCGTALE